MIISYLLFIIQQKKDLIREQNEIIKKWIREHNLTEYNKSPSISDEEYTYYINNRDIIISKCRECIDKIYNNISKVNIPRFVTIM